MTPLNINENYNDIFDFIIKNFLNAKDKNNIKPFQRKIIQTTWNRKQKEVEKYNCLDEKMKLNNLIKTPNLITFSTKLDNIFNK